MPDPIKRPHFFSGKLLTADDLAAEQQYVIEKFKRHNRTLHGFGIVSGLHVTARSGRIVVQAGLAMDCEGNELSIGSEQVIDLPKACDWQTAYLSIRFLEIESAPKESESGMISEGHTFDIVPENSNRSHRHLRGRWLACGQAHPLTIAKLRNSSHVWHVDRGYRPPAIK